MNRRVKIAVQGRVQGVGYRYFVRELASQLQLTGTVRNIFGGDVEIVAEGEAGALEALLVHLKQGPTTSHVKNLHIAWLPFEGAFRGFRIIH